MKSKPNIPLENTQQQLAQVINLCKKALTLLKTRLGIKKLILEIENILTEMAVQ
jgi:hypothetical protein